MSESTEAAQRETVVDHQCLCILVFPPETMFNPDQTEERRSRCQMRAGPDEPFCSGCEKGEHHLLDLSDMRFVPLNERTPEEKE